jgi:hypothetical protein
LGYDFASHKIGERNVDANGVLLSDPSADDLNDDPADDPE